MRSRFLCACALVLALTDLRAQTPAASPTAEPLTSLTNTLGMKFLPVPETTVLFSEFETRVSEFEAFLKEGSYTYPRSLKPHFEQSPDHPVVGVNLQDAIAFCNWLTERERKQGKLKPDQLYRLPTNDEWSKAAGLSALKREKSSGAEQLQDTMRFTWGLQWPPPAGAGNFEDQEMKLQGGPADEFRFTAPVGKFKASPEGLYDLAGNVWEWTWDRELRSTPVGTLRGGSWAYFKREALTIQYVYEVPTELRAPTVGFRCVFEDKQRTAQLLAAANADRARDEAKMKKDLMTRSKVDEKAVANVIKASANTAPPLDASTLDPAKPESPFKNTVRMEFVPIDGLKGILFGRTEVSRAQMEPWLKAVGKTLPSPHFDQTSADPAVNVSWEDAEAWCTWMTEQDQHNKLLPANARYRMPTDVEWSTAAGLKNEAGSDPAARHQGNKEHYPWGTWPPQSMTANLDAPNIKGFNDSHSFTAPVGAIRANSLGIADLGGNVSEWCLDEWPQSPDERVIRGGSWIMSSPDALLTSSRQHAAKATIRYDLGFRCVVDFGATP
ncbi:MAG: SUMF1/EgtB/PvdO family nonheme iron enzyme [Verrucomicrobiaceae bacterium]|nr:SUMF1/EgtB/PvdO family nonheme iron enzyme [Verrucomicrobiaceae bacterium]